MMLVQRIIQVCEFVTLSAERNFVKKWKKPRKSLFFSIHDESVLIFSSTNQAFSSKTVTFDDRMGLRKFQFWRFVLFVTFYKQVSSEGTFVLRSSSDDEFHEVPTSQILIASQPDHET